VGETVAIIGNDVAVIWGAGLQAANNHKKIIPQLR